MFNRVIKKTALTLAIMAVAVLGARVEPGQATTITNGSFETGDFTGWVTQDLTSPFSALQVGGAGLSTGFGFFSSAPTDGAFAALHGFDGNGPGTIRIGQDISIMAGQSTLNFDYRAAWDLTTFCGACSETRTFDVNIETAGGGANLANFAILAATPQTTNLDTGNLMGSIDLSAFSGQTVRVSFDWNIPENFTGPAFFQLDNVTASEGTGPNPVPEPSTMLLLGTGLVGLIGHNIRKRRTAVEKN